MPNFLWLIYALSLQEAAILLINEIHVITFLVVNGIFTLLMESTTNLVLWVIIMTSKEPDGRQDTTFEILNLVELLENYNNFSSTK